MAAADWDVVVVGGGIAGVSLAYELAADRSVCVLEMEPTIGYHTTGRSVATYLESYGNQPIRVLTTGSRDVFTDPPDLFEAPLTAPLPLLYVAGPGRSDALRAMHAEATTVAPVAQLITGDEAELRDPLLRPGWTESALLEPDALAVDVHTLHQGYARGLRRRGGAIHTSAALVGAARRGTQWHLTDAAGRDYRSPAVVDAAGAWCDPVAQVFGAQPLGIQPLRRSVFVVETPAGVDGAALPLTVEVDDAFYIKPEGAQLLCSPADETPQEPADAKPDEVEIARALDAIHEATVLTSRHVRRAWAGLRTFARDRTPVVGFDERTDGFFWFAGQGGYGIQTAPAMARLGAALFRGEDVPADLRDLGLDPAALGPARGALRPA